MGRAVCAWICNSAIALPTSSYPLWDALPEDVVSGGKLSRYFPPCLHTILQLQPTIRFTNWWYDNSRHVPSVIGRFACWKVCLWCIDVAEWVDSPWPAIQWPKTLNPKPYAHHRRLEHLCWRQCCAWCILNDEMCTICCKITRCYFYLSTVGDASALSKTRYAHHLGALCFK